MSDRIKHAKRSQRSYNKNDMAKRSFVVMAHKREEEKEVKRMAKLFKESLNKDNVDAIN